MLAPDWRPVGSQEVADGTKLPQPASQQEELHEGLDSSGNLGAQSPAGDRTIWMFGACSARPTGILAATLIGHSIYVETSLP